MSLSISKHELVFDFDTEHVNTLMRRNALRSTLLMRRRGLRAWRWSTACGRTAACAPCLPRSCVRPLLCALQKLTGTSSRVS